MSMSEEKEQVVSTPIKFTEGAVTQLKRIKQEQDIPDDHGLRVGVKGGGCSGFSYIPVSYTHLTLPTICSV